MLRRLGLRVELIACLAVCCCCSLAVAANDTWDNSPGTNWDSGANWTDGTAPGANDSATFNLALTYSVTVAVDPGVIQALTVSAGSVTLVSSGGPHTLSLTSGSGSQDVVVSGASTTLTLGTASHPLHLVAGDDLSIRTGATLAAMFGSHVTAFDLSDQGLNGTLRVDGAGSILALSGAAATNLVGTSGAGSLVFQNGSTGNTISGALGLADSAATGASGSLSLAGGSTLTLGGNLTLANQNVASQSASISIQGTGSSLTQTGAATVTVGSAASGTATVAIGTTTSGGSFTTGTGLFTVNKTGTVTVGSGANTGTLHIGGDLTINGGILQESNAASTVDFAAGKTIAIQGGGRLTLTGETATTASQIFNVAGTNSRLEVSGAHPLAIGSGAQVNLTSGAALAVGGRIDVGHVAASVGTLSVAGTGSTATSGNELGKWGFDGGAARASFSNAATGTFSGGLDLANSAVAGTTAIVDVLSGASLSVGSLNLAAAGGTTTSATLNINGTSSAVVQSGAAALTLGHASEGTAAINVGTTSDGGALTTGSGLLRINKTGTLTVGDGENSGGLNVLGNIQVDGGLLTQGSPESTFAWTTGKTLTIENGGRVHFASAYVAAPSAIHNVVGANSLFQIDGALHLRSNAQVSVTAGAAIVADEFNVGGGGASGTLVVEGAASTATGGSGTHHWGTGGAANVTFSNQAAGTLSGPLVLAESAATTVNVLSGADLNTGDLSVTTAGGSVAGTLNVVGVGSSINVGAGSHLVIGHATSGSASANVDDGGLLNVGAGGTTTVNGTGSLNIAAGTASVRDLAIVGGAVNMNGGTLAFTSLAINGGLLKFNSGRIEQTGNLAADATLLTTLLGPMHELGLSRTLAAGSGTANVTANLDVNGGRLEGATLAVANTGQTATELRLRGGGTVQVAGAATLAAGTTVLVENASALIAGGQLTQASELQLAGTGRVAASVLANSGLVKGTGRIDANFNNQSSGQVRLAENERLVVRGTSHQNNGLIDVDGGELEVATGSFTNGTVSPSTAVIAARHAALRFTGGLVNAGSIACSEGTCNFFGSISNVSNQPTTGHIVITANSQATFFGDVVNRGTIQVSAAGLVTSTALFLGSLTGNGVSGSGSVFLEGHVSPGATIGTMAFGGDVSLGSAAVLKIEIGGTSPGAQFDRLAALQTLAFGGTLELSLASGFTPAVGQSFDLFDWGSRTGAFTSIQLPSLAGRAWNTSQLYTTGVLSVVAGLAGDFNGDGAVDAADYTVWRDGLGTTYTPADYGVWKSHFGQTASGEAASSVAAAVPEPSTTCLLFLAFAGFVIMSRVSHAAPGPKSA